MIDPSQFRVISGHEFYDAELGLNFPTLPIPDGCCTLPGISADGSYRTRWNGVCHDGLIHANNNASVKLAFNQRMLIDRTDIDGNSIHQQYFDNQCRFLDEDHQVFDELRKRYSAVFEDWEGREDAADLHHAEPHDKRPLRIQGYQSRKDNYGERLWLRRQRLKYKLKKDEIGKPGKAGRMIGDLGVEASLQGAWFTKLDKLAVMDDILLTDGGRTTRVHFCSGPSTTELTQVFDNLQYPPEDAYFVYFSDDACYAAHTEGTVFRANIDISSCDASHTDRLFTKFAELHPTGSARDDVNVLVDQCRAAITIEAPDRIGGKKCKVTLQAYGARLFSGSTLTTVINGFANVCIAQAIHSFHAIDRDGVIAAAKTAGYVVTCDVCEEFEDIQFLKSSPVLDTTGRYRPLLNIGVLLRAFGTCKGDLPGKGDLETRANAFQKALLQGMYPRASFPFLDSLKSKYANAADVALPAKSLADFAHKCTDTEATFTDDAVFKRYYRDGVKGVRLNGCDLAGLEEMIHLEFGWEHASTGADSVLRRDYGLRCWCAA